MMIIINYSDIRQTAREKKTGKTGKNLFYSFSRGNYAIYITLSYTKNSNVWSQGHVLKYISRVYFHLDDNSSFR